ncbi:MAG: hypothetical protein FWC16_09555 [Defluviitaleaceae bacterium]|nr:hypothetical protein [Defluviitaleaceae bacterium]MCL2275158.1 hypothetical protein [Defluviitaleaceae bacterium]
MTAEAIKHSQEYDTLFQTYGGTLAPVEIGGVNQNRNSKCGHIALMKFVKENNEPLPLTAERANEIAALLHVK